MSNFPIDCRKHSDLHRHYKSVIIFRYCFAVSASVSVPGDQPTLAMQGGGSSLLSSAAMRSLSLVDLWRALYGVALPCMMYAACVRLR